MTSQFGPMVIAVFFTDETEFVAGIGSDEALALRSLLENPNLDEPMRDKISASADRVDFLPATQGISGLWFQTADD